MLKQRFTLPFQFCTLLEPKLPDLISKFQRKKGFSVVENIASPQLTDLDLQNFDQFYNPQSILRQIRINGRTALTRRVYVPQMNEVLKIKLGSDFQTIIRFLESRGDFIKDIELAYCLNVIIKNHRQYMPILLQGYLKNINRLVNIKKLKFYSTLAVGDIARANNQFEFLTEESLVIMIDQYLKQCQNIESLIEKNSEQNESNVQDYLGEILTSFSSLASYQYKKNQPLSDLMKVRKILTRKFAHLTFQDVLELLRLSATYRHKFFTEQTSFAKFDEHLVFCYPAMSNIQKINCLTNLAVAQYKQSKFAEKFIIDLYQNTKEFNLDFFTFSNIVWCYSQFELSKLIKEDSWDFLEKLYYHQINFQEKTPNFEVDHSRIVQVFGQNKKGSLNFWKKVEEVTASSKGQSYADHFIILHNFLRLGEPCDYLIDKIIKEEIDSKEFKYLENYSVEQVRTVFTTFTTAIVTLQKLSDQHYKALILLLRQLDQMVFQNDQSWKDIYSDTYERLEYIICLNLCYERLQQYNKIEKGRKFISILNEQIILSYRLIERLAEKEKINMFELIFLLKILETNSERCKGFIKSFTNTLHIELEKETQYENISKATILLYETNLEIKEFQESLIKKVLRTPEMFRINDLIMIKEASRKIISQEQMIYLDSIILKLCVQQGILINDMETKLPKKCYSLIDLIKLLNSQ